MIHICTTRFKNLRYNSIWKLLTVFPVNDFPIFLIKNCFTLNGKRIPGFTSASSLLDFPSSQLIILSVFKYKMSSLLQCWCKLNTREAVKTSPFCFLRDYYGDSLNVIFPQFPNHFLPFLMVLVFLQFSLGVSPISYFRYCVQ